MIVRWAALVMILVGPGLSPAWAAGIEIDQPWLRASLGSVPTSAAYMTIRSDRPDRLLGASTPLAQRVELHNQMEHAGVAQMRPVETLAIDPRSPVVLQPGGLHLMLIGLKERLIEGQAGPLVLTFERAGRVEIQAEIRGVRGQAGHGSHGASGHRPGG